MTCYLAALDITGGRGRVELGTEDRAVPPDASAPTPAPEKTRSLRPGLEAGMEDGFE